MTTRSRRYLGTRWRRHVVHRLLTSGQVPGMFGIGDNTTEYNSMFKRGDFHLNGDVDEFWCGGDENKWMYIRQKSTGMLWVNDGNYGTYGTRGSRVTTRLLVSIRRNSRNVLSFKRTKIRKIYSRSKL